MRLIATIVLGLCCGIKPNAPKFPAPGLVGATPNIMVIRADELRASALGCYGDSNAITPNIDALAAEGVRYTRAIAAEPVCSAHRVSFDLGYYTSATLLGDKLDPSEITTHDVLQAEGYYTAHIGKRHTTPDELVNQQHPQMVPAVALDGWDYHGGHEHSHKLTGVLSIYYENGVTTQLSANPWRPQKHVDLALAQVDQAVSNQQPFYIILDLEPPHFPYEAIEGTVWDVFEAGDISAPPNVPSEHVEQAEIDLALYYAMTYSVDDMVGQVVAHLDEEGLLASTIVVFTSDHGGHLGAHGFIGNNEQKRTPYEESIRVPLIVRGPQTPPGIALNSFVVPVDFGTLIRQKAGAPVDLSSHRFSHLTEGRLLMQRDSPNTPDGAWYGFIREDGMKYARSEGSGPWLLFDTAVDPYEMNNLIGTSDPREAQMQDLLDEAAAAIGLTIPF